MAFRNLQVAARPRRDRRGPAWRRRRRPTDRSPLRLSSDRHAGVHVEEKRAEQRDGEREGKKVCHGAWLRIGLVVWRLRNSEYGRRGGKDSRPNSGEFV
ncbi:unnamed protein product [Acidocella sp. C78]|nr:unnamed protein product [Acidocella sp. C78]